MIIQNKDGKATGGMLKKLVRLRSSTFKICGFEPYTQGQKPSEQKLHEGRQLYSWAEVVNKIFSMQTEMTMVDSTIYIADRVGGFIGPQKLRLTRNGQVCASMKQQRVFADFTGSTWDLIVGPGIDPCLMIAFIAIVDEIKEG
jgi:hypothetical protein